MKWIQIKLSEFVKQLDELDVKGMSFFNQTNIMSLKDSIVELKESIDAPPDRSELRANRRIERIRKSQISATVMIVDDDIDLQRIVRFFLEKIGFKVVSETDTFEALAKVNAISPDIIIVDVLMPGMDGFEFIGKLKEKKLNPNTKIVIGSVKNNESDKKKAIKLGVDNYFSKPYNMSQLCLDIQTILFPKEY